jgi:soluble lytic murein transglycosylase-like protein
MRQDYDDEQEYWDDEDTQPYEVDAEGYEYVYETDYEESYVETEPEQFEGQPLSNFFSNGPRPAFIVISILVACLFLVVGLVSLSGSVVIAANEAADAIATQVAAQAPAAGQTAAGKVEVPADCAVSDLFPDKVRRWCGLITQYAQKHQLAPDLVAAVIWLESGGDEVAYSRSGAVGLMQVMPSDGPSAAFMCVNGPCFSDRPTIAQLQDPEFNIAYGTRMLSGLISKSGDLREALKSYGPMDSGYSYADKVLGIFQRYKK